MTNEQKQAFFMRVGDFEGFRSQPYYCPAGCLTIGFGHRITDNERQRLSTAKLTFKQAFDLLVSDFDKVFDFLSKQHFILQEYELFAIADLCFNVGCSALSARPIWKLLQEYSFALDRSHHFEADRLRKVIAERITHYIHYKRNGKTYTSENLIARRNFDSKLFLGDVYILK